MVDGRQYINFSSNDYLGLSSHPEVKQAFCRGIEQWGAGSGASRLISGSLQPHQRLEAYIAEKKGKAAARVFANGYATSLGVLSGLFGKEDVILLDKLSHASLIDGARLSGATLRVFPHNHMVKLRSLLEKYKNHSGHVLIVTESIFSMDGDAALLEQIIALKKEFGALLLVDEAHALGVCGAMGLACSPGDADQIDLHMGTLGKAAGVAGGYVACSQDYADLIVNTSRSFIYSTAPPAGQAEAALKSLELIHAAEGKQRRQTLWENIQHFCDAVELAQRPQSAIIPWHVGEAEAALKLSEQLFASGMLVPAVRYPTVPRKTARLRITLSANHTKSQIEQLSQHLLGK